MLRFNNKHDNQQRMTTTYKTYDPTTSSTDYNQYKPEQDHNKIKTTSRQHQEYNPYKTKSTILSDKDTIKDTIKDIELQDNHTIL